MLHPLKDPFHTNAGHLVVDDVQILEANTQYAHVRFTNRHELTVSVHDLTTVENRSEKNILQKGGKNVIYILNYFH